MITTGDAVTRGTRILTEAGLQSARLDAQILAGHILGIERATLYAYPERPMTAEQERQFLHLIERRARGEPVAYLVGHKEFYGLDFFVDQRVLIPRPETELLVEAALAVIRRKIDAGEQPIVADIGTGSGAIAITLAVEEPRLLYLYACDISQQALEVAQLNSQRHHVENRVHLRQGDLLAALPEPVDVLLANLPYVGTTEMELLTPDVHAYEPHLALFSGPYGLGLLQRFCKEAQQSGMLKDGGVMILEIGYQQREPLMQLIHELWPHASIAYKKDYGGWDRLLQITV
ncbi:MAG TPA: peptide chain release factor N(5)-glutamine methyltransferase [Ktedonosporobacter sp.]|jgi:release factor glutamine methyltransferase|nr:peptide chain release factor N(5)-glutamine methyltransferase [Ktedonosporobacter sp.]